LILFLKLTKQTLYHLTNTPSLFCISYFFK
jgi:hypothetical protein